MMESESNSEEEIAAKVNVYRHIILKRVNGAELVPHLVDIISEGERSKIVNLAQNESSQKATEYLLHVFEKIEYVEGKWRAFINALRTAEYPYVTEILEGNAAYRDKNENEEKIIKVLAPKIGKLIFPKEIVPLLHSKEIINQRDVEEISTAEDRKGPSEAASLMLDKIPRRIENWYELFLQVLIESEDGRYKHVATIIDEDFVAEKENQLAAKANDDELKQSKDTYCDKDKDEDNTMENLLHEKENQLAAKANHDELKQSKDTYCDKDKDEDNTMENLLHASGPPYQKNDVNAPYSSRSTIEEECSVSMNDSNSSLTRVVKGAENDDNEITKVKQLDDSASSQGNITNYENDEITMVKWAYHEENDKSFALNIPCDQKSELYTKCIDVFESFEREFGVVEDLELNIQREDSRDLAENQSPENMAGVKEPLELRLYQEELARPGLAGKNNVIVAPTGSGKTHVAMKIMQNHFEKMKGKCVAKLAFLVEQSALAEQQARQFLKYLQASVKTITGESQRTEKLQLLSHWLDKRDILVVTSQILVNALDSGDVRIQDFTLMVFDECHHTASKHPYNQIMQRYLDLKLDREPSLPQVVGLTASVGVGKANGLAAAKEWVKKLMANLDADELATVRENKKELSEYTNIPEKAEVIKVFGREQEKDVFGQVLNKIMEKIEMFMRTSEFAKMFPDADIMLKAPAKRGVDQYTQWISDLWRQSARIIDQNARRFFVTCRDYLEIYNKGLVVYADARVKDALHLIKDGLKKLDQTINDDETKRKLETLYTKSEVLLQQCETDPDHDNPKLEKLKEIILREYQENGDMRCIVFVKTRDLTKAIETWMKETQGLKELRPVKFVGTQASKDKGGMTKAQQVNTLDFFRDGQHKLIISTSVAEEGLDIRKCNLVIRYDYVTNEKSSIQTKGRGRAEDSKYIVLAEHGRGTAEKEEINFIRERLMNDAIIGVWDDIRTNPRDFKTGQETFQKDAKVARDVEAKARNRRSMMEDEFEMRCFRCSCFICFSSDIRKIQNAHHAAICGDISDRVVITKTKPQYSDDLIKTGIGKVNCLNCRYDLGNVALYKNVQFPVMKCSGFLFVDNREGGNVFKRWIKVRFPVQDLSAMDLERMAEYPLLVNC